MSSLKCDKIVTLSEIDGAEDGSVDGTAVGTGDGKRVGTDDGDDDDGWCEGAEVAGETDGVTVGDDDVGIVEG